MILTGLLFPNCLLLKESPIWLIRQKRSEEAIDTLKIIAEVNSTRETSDWAIEQLESNLEAENFDEKTDQGGKPMLITNLSMVCQNLTMINSLIILSAVISAQLCVFYGISSSVQDLGFDSIQINGSITGITQGLGFIIVLPFLNKFSRKKSLLLIQLVILIESSLLLLLSLIPKRPATEYLQALIGSVMISCTISALFSFSYLANAEAFPPQIRGACVGLILLLGKAVGSTSPYLSYQSKSLGVHQLVGCSLPLIISSLLTLELAELPSTSTTPDKY